MSPVKYRILSICLVVVAAFALLIIPSTALALNNNRIIDNTIFDNYNSMSAAKIDSFLNSKGDCISSSSGFRAINPIGYNENDGFIFGGPVTAGTVIYSASQAYEINPQVLLTTLQKEQGIVAPDGSVTCDTNTIAKSMGYGCPDTYTQHKYTGLNLYWRNGIKYSATTGGGICVNNSNKAGFSQQIIRAAWMLKYSRMRAEGNVDWAIIKGSWDNSDDLNATFSGYMTEGCLKRSKYESHCTDYDGYATIDGQSVHMDNGATAALYRYTPHFHGQELFTNIFTPWFGYTLVPLIFSRGYDVSTDKTGERAKIGIWLGKRPTANVTIPIFIYSPSNDRIVGGATTITITPTNFDWPEKNIVLIAGMDNQYLHGNVQNQLRFGRPTSNDPFYNNADLSAYNVPIIHQDSSNNPEVFRLYKSGLHYFTASPGERDSLIGSGWSDENAAFNYCYNGDQVVVRLVKDGLMRLAVKDSSAYQQAISDGFTVDQLLFTASTQGNTSVYWRFNPSTGNSLYTTSSSEGLAGGYIDKGEIFKTCSNDNQSVYRLYRQDDGDYFLTRSAYERDRAVNSLGYTYEGHSFYTCQTGGTESIYRLYNPTRRKHLYTSSSSEYNKAINNGGGWIADGVVFTLCINGTNPVYRLYKESIGKYLYTASATERDKAVASLGYANEGVIFTGQ